MVFSMDLRKHMYLRTLISGLGGMDVCFSEPEEAAGGMSSV